MYDEIENNKEYHGKFVALREFNDTEVICYDKEPYNVIKRAKELGIIKPVILYVTNPDLTSLY